MNDQCSVHQIGLTTVSLSRLRPDMARAQPKASVVKRGKPAAAKPKATPMLKRGKPAACKPEKVSPLGRSSEEALVDPGSDVRQ